MKKFFYSLIAPASSIHVQYALLFMRLGIGLLTIGHGIPKIAGGHEMWQFLGGAMTNLGIHFLHPQWGFIAACTEFFGGIALTLGLGTRAVSLLLSYMMVVAFMMHINQGDPFNVYSFALSMLVIFLSFAYMGGGIFSLDHYMSSKK